MVMKKNALVSIISACYNEGEYLRKLLDSILNQTYKNIEMIFVDDGSTDDTAEIINQYMDLFDLKGMKLKYFFQENTGQAAATNRALKEVKGDYFCWIDGDDYLYPEAVEKKVDYLEKNLDCGMVTSDFYIYYLAEGRVERKGKLYGTLNWQSNQFFLTVTGESIIENLAHMIRTESYRKANPAMNIVDTREGQNYQIIIPVLYLYKRGYIDEPLACYRIHADSHSRRYRTYEEQISRYDSLIDMLRKTLEQLGIPEKSIDYIIRESTFCIEKERYIDYAGT